MRILCASERAHESDNDHCLVNREMPLAEDNDWTTFSDSRSELWGWNGKVHDVRMNGDYRIQIVLSRNDIANLLRIAWGSKPLKDFILAMSESPHNAVASENAKEKQLRRD